MAVVGVSHMLIGVPVPMTRFITRRGDVGDGWGSFGVRGRYASGMAFTIFYFFIFFIFQCLRRVISSVAYGI